MSTNKIISSLAYFSVFFAPFLLPLITWIIGEEEVKHHSKRALISHIIPFVMIIALIIIALVVGGFSEGTGIAVVIGVGVFGLISFGIMIWNVVMGIKVLMN
ncbi:DUF4870 domain-containing protein [Pontibacillus salicampi]|uniref:DUF4870 domain-containing protein n=1 Tax=Pontibacillus salicampi TaxID=1449801 RepID=A0ABV6LQ65_9BACI